MKKTISLMLITALLLSSFIVVGMLYASATDYISPEALDGTDNVFLSYTFYHKNWATGRRTKEQYLPLVGYTDTEGNVTDIFFDSYLFLPCVTTAPSGGAIYRDNNNPSNFSDWQMFVEDVFLEGFNLPALNRAVEETKEKLGEGYEDFKANVFLTVLYPTKTQRNFGDIDNDGIVEDFNKTADRYKAIKWIIDTQLQLFEEGNFSHLNLVGFYWFEENIQLGDVDEGRVIRYMTDYVRNKNLKSIWIPYYNASGYNRWSEYGIDAAIYQPNYMFYDVPESRVRDACNTAKRLGMGIEMEIDSSVFTTVEKYNRYMTYLKVATEQGANQGVKMYYNDAVPGVYLRAYESENPIVRRIYDLTYKYAKQTLTPGEIIFLNTRNRYEDYDIVSVDKPYTTTTPYTDSTSGYANVSGKELTDGAYGISNYGTEWIAFHKSLMQEGAYYINLDLERVYNDLSLFALEVQEDTGAGISYPGSVEYFVSTDGVDYTSLGYGKIDDSFLAGTEFVYKPGFPVSARYIRVKILPGKYNFVFASELSVGITSSGRFGTKHHTNVALDKSYVSTPPFTDSDLGYAKVSGKELTDGAYAFSEYGVEWCGFNHSDALDGNYFITVDLEDKTPLINLFCLELEEIPSASVGLPQSVSFYASDNGVDFTFITSATPVLNKDKLYSVIAYSSPVSARYIKAVMDKGKAAFAFVSEFYIGAIPAPELNPHTNISTNNHNLVINGITENKTAQETKSLFKTPVTIKNKSGKVMKDSDLAGTGALAVYIVGDREIEYVIVVKGDIDGDGKVTSLDYLMIRRGFLKTLEYTHIQELAADINGDSRINAIDYLRVKRHFLGTYNIFET